MNRKDIKYLEKTKTNNWVYPEHFVSPNDDFTTNIPLWTTLFNELGINGVDNLTFLELGTGQGRATVWLLENILTGKDCFIDTIDISGRVWYDPETKRCVDFTIPSKKIEELILIDCVDNLTPYININKTKFHRCDTKTFFFENKYENKVYDFIYIDAGHDKSNVFFDSACCFQVLKKDGIIIFDDYGWGNCKYGIDSFLCCFDEKVNLIYKQWQVIIQKL